MKFRIILPLFIIALFLPFVSNAKIGTVKKVRLKYISESAATVTWKKIGKAKFYRVKLQDSSGKKINLWKKVTKRKKRIKSSKSKLEAEKSYQVQVKACRTKKNCGKWSMRRVFALHSNDNNQQNKDNNEKNRHVNDKDGDGVDGVDDCDDSDKTVSEYKKYYYDFDEDGYGSSISTNLCKSSAPSGYSVNSTDCDDGNSALHAKKTYYKDNDGDGLGDPNSSVMQCTNTPSGYVTNGSDSDDDDYFNGNNPTCSSDFYNCSSFTSQSAAQAVYEYCIAEGYGDIHRLDGDDNGLACESLD